MENLTYPPKEWLFVKAEAAQRDAQQMKKWHEKGSTRPSHYKFLPNHGSTVVAVSERRGKLTNMEREKLINENRCFYCHKVGHRAIKEECPSLQARHYPKVFTPTMVKSDSLGLVQKEKDSNLSRVVIFKNISVTHTIPMLDVPIPLIGSVQMGASHPDDQEMIVDETNIPKWINNGDEKIFKGLVKQTDFDNKWSKVEVLHDSGSSGMLIDLTYCINNSLIPRKCPPCTIMVADTRQLIIDQEIQLDVRIGNWLKKIIFSVTTLPYDMIFGLPFEHSIRILNGDWNNKIMTFETKIGTRHTWYGKGYLPPNDYIEPILSVKIEAIKKIEEATSVKTLIPDGIDFDEKTKLCSSFIETKVAPKSNLESQKDFIKTLIPELKTILEPFLKTVLSDPPHVDHIPHRKEDQKIPFVVGAELKHQPLRQFSEAEDKLIKEHIDDLLEKGMIQVSNSPYGANIVFAKKKDGGLRLCIDYCLVNNITIKDCTPLPTHTEIRQRVRGAKYLSKIDIRDAFHMVRINAADCHKTAFQTRYGLFEYTVSPFGLSNSPATFMKLMNRIFHDMTDRNVIFYVDDVLIYSNTLTEHLQAIAEVFKRLEQNSLRVKLSKCEFAVDKLEWCGMEVSTEGFAIQQSQIEAMCNYPPYDPLGKISVITYTQQFLGSVQFFADFIPWLGEIAYPLYDLTKKDNKNKWNVDHQSIQRIIQHYLILSPQLKYFDPALVTGIKTDASDFAIGGWLYQIALDGSTNIVAYWSRKLIPAERHYPVHERELLAIHDFVERFCVYLFGITFECHTDHKGLEHIQTQPKLSSRQVQWIQYLQDFNFTIEYISGKSNTFADWLSRRPDFADFTCIKCKELVNTSGMDEDDKQNVGLSDLIQKCDNPTKILTVKFPHLLHDESPYIDNEDTVRCDHKVEKFDGVIDVGMSAISENANMPTHILENSYNMLANIHVDHVPFINEIHTGQLNDPFCQELTKFAINPNLTPFPMRGLLKSFSQQDEVWFYQNRAIVIPNGDLRLKLLEHFHNRVNHGHKGIQKTYQAMVEMVYWKSMLDDIELFVASCPQCQRSKPGSN